MPRPGEAGPIWDDIWHLEAHNSTAIEGNTLVLREVEQLLDAGRAVGAKPLKDYLEVLGYGEAARWVYDQASGAGAYPSEELVTVTEVREVHRLALGRVWSLAPHPAAGQTERARSNDVRPRDTLPDRVIDRAALRSSRRGMSFDRVCLGEAR